MKLIRWLLTYPIGGVRAKPIDVGARIIFVLCVLAILVIVLDITVWHPDHYY